MRAWQGTPECQGIRLLRRIGEGVVEQGQVLVSEVLVAGMDEVMAAGSVFGVVKVEEGLETVALGLDQEVVVQEIWVDSVSEVGAPEVDSGQMV